MTLHLKSKGYPLRPRLLFSCFIVVGFGFPTVYYFRRGQISNPCSPTHVLVFVYFCASGDLERMVLWSL